MELQIAIDGKDPHALVAFYAAGFGYEVEVHDELVRQVLDAGQATPDDVVELDGGRLAWKGAAACRHPTMPRLLFQAVPEHKARKNRVHLDFHAEDRHATVERLLALGATKRWDGRQGPSTWVRLTDPEGTSSASPDRPGTVGAWPNPAPAGSSLEASPPAAAGAAHGASTPAPSR